MPTAPNVARMVEDIVGCKWSLAVLGAVRGGVCRPGAMEHAIEGLSKKVLNERLSKLVRFGILEKQAYPELPPRVEYRFTPFGDKFLRRAGRHRRAAARDRSLDRSLAPTRPSRLAADDPHLQWQLDVETS